MHTEHPEWFEERWGKRVVRVAEGVPAELEADVRAPFSPLRQGSARP